MSALRCIEDSACPYPSRPARRVHSVHLDPWPRVCESHRFTSIRSRNVSRELLRCPKWKAYWTRERCDIGLGLTSLSLHRSSRALVLGRHHHPHHLSDRLLREASIRQLVDQPRPQSRTPRQRRPSLSLRRRLTRSLPTKTLVQRQS